MQTPFVLVIFGATGDLAHHKLLPSLFSLFTAGKLPEKFFIVGFARRMLSNEEFRGFFSELASSEKWEEFKSHLIYQQGSFEDKSAYLSLAKRLFEIDQLLGTPADRILYLATPPQNYDIILDSLYTYKKELSQKEEEKPRFAKLVIEKPFGKDLPTARALDKKLQGYFEEWQIFRVDHYLGKETVQNMLVFRFANSIFEPMWNNQYIDNIQITFAEEKGIGSRGKFFDGVGVLRDVGQNHLMQLVAAVAMEQPKSFSKEGVRDARAHALSALVCIDPKEVNKFVVRGQYNGYLMEKDVMPQSKTETFVALKMFVNTDRFLGVPFYIRAGKKLAKDMVKVSIVFKQTCHILFKEIGCPEEGNILTFFIQPDEGIGLRIIAKNPGGVFTLGNTDMHFLYKEQFKSMGTAAYDKVLLDIFSGDQMLFNRSDELEKSWEFITNILEGWEKEKSPLFPYESGSRGPQSASNLLELDQKKWV